VSSSFDRSVLDHLRAALGDDSGVFARRVIATFLRQGEQLVSELERASRDQDLPGVVLAAHTLKGSSGTVGGQRLTDLCERLEHWEGSTCDLAPLVGSVREEVRMLDLELSSYL
jgi:HPt (histidine-containing phosphotransfer) domain-containing protein